MAERKNKKIKDKQSNKWIDMRVIVPSIILAFLFSITMYLFVDHSLILMSVWTYLSAVYGFALFVQPEGVLFYASEIAFFTVDLIVVFFLSYLVLWFIVREEDKRLYRQYKKKGLVK